MFQWAISMGSPSRVPERSRPQFEALDALWTRWAAFRSRPFPHEWAKVVNGVGLATLSMRAETCLNTLFGYYPPGRASMRMNLTSDLDTAVAWCDEALPCLPDEPRQYFEDLRSILHDATTVLGKLSWTENQS